MAKKPTKAFYNELNAIADKVRPKIQRQVREAIEELKGKVSAKQLETIVREGDQFAVLRALKLENMEKELGPVVAELQGAFINAAQTTAGLMEGVVGARMTFDLTSPQSIEFIRQYKFDLIQRISRKTKEGVQEIIKNAFERGGHPFQQAQQIRETVGLLPRQATAVENFREMLISEGRTAAQVERMTEKYTQRQLRYRARNIARTETIRAANMGQQTIWRQAVDEGLLPRDAKKVWIVTDDDRLCPFCEELDGKVVGLEDTFTSTVTGARGGTRSYTELTPPLHPSCRCGLGIAPE